MLADKTKFCRAIIIDGMGAEFRSICTDYEIRKNRCLVNVIVPWGSYLADLVKRFGYDITLEMVLEIGDEIENERLSEIADS